MVNGTRRRSNWLAAGVALLLPFGLISCGDGDTTSPPTTGNLTVSAATTGSDLDADGYMVSVDGGTAKALAVNGSVSFTGLAAGSHQVELTGLAANCSVTGDNPRSVSVTAGATASTTFNVTCSALTGDLEVRTSTTGSDLDPDGYTVSVDGGAAQAIAINDTLSLTGLSVGDHTVELAGVAANCVVGGSNPRTVTIPSGGAAATQFDVTCSQIVGNLDVITATTGADLDPDGYTVSVDGGAGQAIAINDTLSLTGLAAGDHTVELGGVAANCTVGGANPRTVTVPADGTAATQFDVTCSSLTGGLDVITATTGADLDPDGYTVSVDGGAGQAIAINDTLSLTGLSVGDHTVELTGVAANCTVGGSNPRTVTVPSGGTATTQFDVTCAQIVGNLDVTTTTTGNNPPAGYNFTVDGGAPQAIGANATVTLTGVPAGDHSVLLTDVPGNCTVTGANPVTATVPANGTGVATFDVTCTAGNLDVTTETWGLGLDPDGYSVTVDGGAPQAVGVNGMITIQNLAAGDHTVELTGIAANCTVQDGPNPRTETIVDGSTTATTFRVFCFQTLTNAVVFETDRDGNREVYVKPVGAPQAINLTNNAAADGRPDVAPDGSAVVFESDRDGSLRLWRMDANGFARVTSSSAIETDPSYARDVNQIAYQRQLAPGRHQIWRTNLMGTSLNPVSTAPGGASDEQPAYSPDGNWILFQSDRDGNTEIYVVNVGTGVETRLTTDPANDGKPAWWFDGTKVLWVSNRSGDFEVYVADFDPVTPSIGVPTNLSADATQDDKMPDMKPDGTLIVFVRDGAGTNDIWTMNPDGSGQSLFASSSTANDAEPAWSP